MVRLGVKQIDPSSLVASPGLDLQIQELTTELKEASTALKAEGHTTSQVLIVLSKHAGARSAHAHLALCPVPRRTCV